MTDENLILGYKLGPSLGSGAFSEVFAAQKEGHAVAIKLMRPPAGADADLILSTLRYEFWVLKDLKHPHIIQVKDFGELPDGRIFIIEERLTGEPLDVFCAGRSFAECAPVFIDCLKGLHELERWHIVHGDLKPANIFVTHIAKNPQAKILDFGLARPVTAIPRTSGMITAPALHGGTPSTMAPEVILHRPCDHRADLYSLGVTFYTCLAGKNPFMGKNSDETAHAHLHSHPELMGLLRSDVPPAWAELIHQMLAKNPSDRPASALKALSLVQQEAFILTSTAFVGRAAELKEALKIAAALGTGQRTALVVHGKPGVGVSRFLREVFYQMIAHNPAQRHTITLLENKTSKIETPLLLLDRSLPPKGYHKMSLTLGPLTCDEVEEWLCRALNVQSLPQTFLAKIYQLTLGHPASIWELLTRLAEKNRLTDVTGLVTAATLSLIDWDDILPGTVSQNGLKESFAWLIQEAQRKVGLRKIFEGDALWLKLGQLTEEPIDTAARLQRRGQVLALKGEALIDEGKFDRAREALKSALAIFNNDGVHRVEELRLRCFLAYLLLRQGKAQDAIAEFENVLNNMIKHLSPEQAAQITNLDLGFAYLQAGLYEKAVARLLDERKTALPKKISSIDYNLAQAYAGLNDTDKAAKYYQDVLEQARKNSDPAFILRSLNGLGSVLSPTDAWEKARGAFGEALDVALAIGDFTSAAAICQNRGVLNSQQDLPDQAIRDLEDSLTFAAKIVTPYAFEKRLICRSFVELGEIYTKKWAWEKMRDYLNRAWHMAEDDDDLKDFRFWVLLACCRAWQATKDDAAYQRDFSRLSFYADDAAKKSALQKLNEEHRQHQSDQTKAEPMPQVPSRVTLSTLDAILRINRDLVGEMTLTELLSRILGHAIELSKAELGVMLLKEAQQKLTPVLSLNAELNEALSEVSLSVAQQVLTTGQAVKTIDASQDLAFNQSQSVIALNLKSILGVPIIFRGKVLGVLYLSHRLRAGAFDETITSTIEAFADQVGLALTNHHLLEFQRNAQRALKSELEISQLDLKRAQEQMRSLPEKLKFQLTDRPMLTRSTAVIEILKSIDRLAESTVPIVIHGETGTGKELMARYIHQTSARKQQPFVAINCGALPANLIESELFGHVKGAFTGADRDKIGLLEAASGGTLFLDEIGDLPLDLQVKFLRVLQEREVVRLGDRQGKPVDVRVVAASHRELRTLMTEKKFREDLYYRLAGFEILLPALKDRREDIPLLAEHFLLDYCLELKRKKPERISGALMTLMEAYAWPGNVRELRNFVATAAALCDKAILGADALPKYLQERLVGKQADTARQINTSPKAAPIGWHHPGLSWDEHERLIFASALIAFDFDAPRVALSLGVSVATVYKWMRVNRIRESASEWQKKILPYIEGTKLNQIRKGIFAQVAKKFPGQPYLAARELKVAPMTYYKWTQMEKRG